LFSANDVIASVKEKVGFLHRDVCSILELHESNKIVIYSKKISGQIPSSHAAWAFKSMQDAMMQNEILGVCRIWDTSQGTNGIPGITKILVENDLKQNLFDECLSQWPNETSFSNQHCTKIFSRFQNAMDLACSTVAGDIHLRLLNLRNKHLAHVVSETRAEKKFGPISPAQYGDERVLLENATEIIESYYLAVNGVSFSMVDHKAMYQRRAEAFWNGVTINVLK
jgi:AbiU2